MGDQSRSTALDFYRIFGIKSLVTRWNTDKNPSIKSQKQGNPRQINDDLFKAPANEKNVEDYVDRIEDTKPPPSMEFDESFFWRPPILLKSLTKRNQTPSTQSSNPAYSSRSKSTSRGIRSYASPPSPSDSSSHRGSRRSKASSKGDSSRSKSTGRGIRSDSSPPSPTDSSPSNGSRRGKASSRGDSSRSKSTSRRSKSHTLTLSPTNLSLNGSKRSASEAEIPSSVSPSPKTPTPILYSQSKTWRTPQAIEMKLECTLEELCHGCVKKIAITRDVISNGVMKKEEEVLTINVKPGWRKGTKIRFEGKGSEIAGKNNVTAADIVFLIEEIQHPLFSREGDDLEYGIEIPLMEALIGCSISVPLLGDETMWLTFSDIIYPGFEKVLPGQGMPTKIQGKRGNLRLKFFIQFPKELTQQQRLLASSILQDCC